MPPQFFENLSAILLPFHSSKNAKNIQKLMFQLWEPLIWRYLKVANSQVRQNATQILGDAFPLEDPEETLENRAQTQEMQIAIFLQLLKDSVPDVRVQAVNSVCLILTRFWILFSPAQIQGTFYFIML